MVDLMTLVAGLVEDESFSQALCFTNTTARARRLSEILPNEMPLTVLTSAPKVAETARDAGLSATLLEDSLSAHDLGVLSSVQDLVVQALGEGAFGEDDRLLVVLAEPLEGVIIIEPGQLVLNHLASLAAEHGVELEVLTRIIELARRLGSRGRENRPVGGLFAIGSVPKLRRHTTALVLNPFKGHSVAKRSVLDAANLESLAEFAWLDGAILFNVKGVASDAGRYVQVGAGVGAKPGEGGRHLAARAISQIADCIAVCVSSAGVISVYSKGRSRYHVKLN